ncbi:MAG: hypothetical protein D6815_02100 [Candidatus Dadabacteria bacterium]|nr:MAG: hypothetical protein D6815_02100 [Candidatus Dadabacteria bacterium]
MALLTEPDARGAQYACTVSYTMEALVAIGDLRFESSYPSGVDPAGSGAAVSCRSLVRDDEPVQAEFFDDDAGTLSFHFWSAGGFPGFNPLAICDLTADHVPQASEFSAATISALDPQGAPLVPLPAVTVREVFCPTTTTTTTTTTTVPAPVCGDADGNGRVDATDALLVLWAAVERLPCPPSRCDASGDGRLSASDALLVLRAAVGLPAALSCPATGP